MREVDVQIVNRRGLHARAAARLMHLANQFESRITVTKGNSTVDGKSMLGLLTLAAGKGSRLRITADGPDASQALQQLAELIRGQFGEED